jgi:hypothetical protein
MNDTPSPAPGLRAGDIVEVRSEAAILATLTPDGTLDGLPFMPDLVLVAGVVEAARGIEWWRVAGRDGLVLGIDRFGASAPEKALAEEYGFTPAKVADRLERWLKA